MTDIKWFGRMLLAGAALGGWAAAASADELSALKAQIEALQSKLDRLDYAQQPSLPPGAKLVTLRHGTYASSLDLPMRAVDDVQDWQGYTIAITPTADLPAPVAEIRVTGEIRTRLLYFSEENNDEDSYGTDGIDLNADADVLDAGEDLDYSDNYFDLTSRGRLRVDAHTETAVGEVGGIIRLQGTDTKDALMQIAWGYWKMTPALELGGGYYDSISTIRAGLDWNGNGSLYGYTGLTNAKVPQFRLTYNAGNGLSLAAGLEDNNLGDLPAVAGSVLYKQDSFFLTASAIWEVEDDDTGAYDDAEDNWFAGVGGGLNIGEQIHVEGAIGRGEGYDEAVYIKRLSTSSAEFENDYEFWAANAFLDFKFGDGMKIQLSYSYADMDHEHDDLTDDQYYDAVSKSQAFGGALFWDPVSELTLGVGASHRTREDNDGTERREVIAGFGAWFRF